MARSLRPGFTPDIARIDTIDLNAPAIDIRDLSKFYGTFQALHGSSLTVRKGERAKGSWFAAPLVQANPR